MMLNFYYCLEMYKNWNFVYTCRDFKSAGINRVSVGVQVIFSSVEKKCFI